MPVSVSRFLIAKMWLRFFWKHIVQVWTSAWTHIWRLWSWHCEEKILWHLTILVFVATTSDTTFSLIVWILILFLLMILLVWRSRSPLLVCIYLLKSILLDWKYTALCKYSTVFKVIFKVIHMLTLQSLTTKYPVVNLVCHVCLNLFCRTKMQFYSAWFNCLQCYSWGQHWLYLHVI